MDIHWNCSMRSIAVGAVVLAAFSTSIMGKAIRHPEPSLFSTVRGGLRPAAGGHFLPIPLAHGAKTFAIPLAKGPLRVLTTTVEWQYGEDAHK